MRKIRVFISSPSDVEAERSIAMTILNRLNRRYKEHLNIEGIFWKEKPLSAGSHFQDEIEDPSTADIVIVILWSRLGTNLSKDYKGKITNKQPITGTEWEFEDARHQYNTCGKPHVIVYKKNSDIIGIVGDKKEYERKTKDKDRLDEFMNHWFINKDGTFKKAFHSFEHLREFENRVETHLESLIQEYLKDMIGENTRWFQGSPFRGLNSFDLEHEEIFFGRREQIHQIRTTFLNLAQKQKPFLLVIGASGCGKSSLLKAGVLPYLLQPDVAKDIAIVKHCIFKPNDNQTDLLYSLSNALFKTLEEELRALGYTPQKLKEILSNTNITPIKQAINKIKDEKKLIKEAKVKIVIIIDQFEEIFTNKSFSKEQKEQFIKIINTFVKSDLIWILASMRSDFIKDTDSIPQLKELLNQDENRYLLSFPSTSQTRELIVEPAKRAGVRYERKDGKDLDELLLENATKNGTSLPLLEYVLEELYISRTKENLLTFEAYENMGEIEGAIGKKAESVYNNLTKNEQKAFESLIRMLVVMAGENNREKTAKTITYESIKDNKDKIKIIELMSSKEVRLFVKDRDSSGNLSIRVTHEALFNNWQRAIKIISISQQDIIIRERLEKTSHDWKNTNKKDKNSLLLNDGLPLNEALDLTQRREDELSDTVLEFVRQSKDRVKRKKWYKMSLLAAGVVGSVAMYGFYQDAKTEGIKADKSKEETQNLVKYVLDDFMDKIEPYVDTKTKKVLQEEIGKYVELTDNQNNSKQSAINEVREKLQEYQLEVQNRQDIYQDFFRQESDDVIKKQNLLADKDDNSLNILHTWQVDIKQQLSSTTSQNNNLVAKNLRAIYASNQGEIYEIEGKTSGALQEYLNASEIYKKLIELEPDNNEWRQNLAETYINIGQIYRKLGDYSKALHFFQNSQDIMQKLVKLNPDNIEWQLILFKGYDNKGVLYTIQGDYKYEDALKEYKNAQGIIKKLIELEPDNSALQLKMSENHERFGHIYQMQDKLQKALEEYQYALKIKKVLIEIDSNNNMWQYEISISYSKIGDIYRIQGAKYKLQGNVYKLREDFSSAEQEYRKSIQKYEKSLKEYENSTVIREKLIKLDPANTKWLEGLVWNYKLVSFIYGDQENSEEALVLQQKSLEITKKLVAIDPNNTDWQDNLARSYFMMGFIYKNQGKPTEALAQYQKSLEIFNNLTKFTPSNTDWQVLLAGNYSIIGSIIYYELKNPSEALPYYKNSLEIRKKLVNLDPSNKEWQDGLAVNYNILGSIYKELEKPLVAFEQFEKSQEIIKNVIIGLDPNMLAVQSTMLLNTNSMAEIYIDQGKLEEATLLYEGLLETYKELIKQDSTNYTWQYFATMSYIKLCTIEWTHKKDFNKGIKYLEDGVEFLQKLKDDGTIHKDVLPFIEIFKEWIVELKALEL